ncbi:class I SAM-dependent methyltransferase [Autumnicola musiva]|uniref:Methyltransferase domain-containing protein n=1 Tax=Autumnicola musiva TaxID=3075589 RepID=A0ABU3D5Q7_9FLAO|nr:methyltransferase domain-containing protein [Zunongwangia sp. F117]MDT0676867.1 methyltransferase domain-containing protein [Zunongwangia sp. F117]
MKDNFSTKSEQYAKFRPTYPAELYDFLRKHLNNKLTAWDCGTGNGQVAAELAAFFQEVYATDISEQQLENAVKKSNITYSKQPAEKTIFPDNYFDLVTVAQAIHWFDFDKFYAEVKRVVKPDGLIAVLGYGLFSSDSKTNKVIHHFYREITDPYWDPERKYLDEEYKTIPFPFAEIETPHFRLELNWSLDQLLGYLKTWSAVKHYENANGENPVDLVADDFRKSFGTQGRVIFPILFRLAKVTA